MAGERPPSFLEKGGNRSDNFGDARADLAAIARIEVKTPEILLKWTEILKIA